MTHPAPWRHRRGRVLTRVAATTVLAALVAATPAAAQAAPRAKALAVPRIKVSLPASIEDIPPYVPQVSCDATAKPGAIALMNLLLKTYPGSTNMGIVHTCAEEGMTSEHAEGRALDWGVNRNVAKQKAQAQSFLTWLFATDADGNEQAMARRLGVMYVIWNDRIRMTGGDWRPYDASICGKKGHSPTTCHENHVHISLTWAGAWKRTSFWTGKVAPDDYGPCKTALQIKTNKPAHKYTKINLTPCPGTRGSHGGGSGSGGGSGGGWGGGSGSSGGSGGWGGGSGGSDGSTGGSTGGAGSGGPDDGSSLQCPDGTTPIGWQDGVLVCLVGPGSSGAGGASGGTGGTSDPSSGP
ncbi:MAG TPA: hypothetical protein VHE83_04035 [Mycobacteriales bacterium]|nr:hypothetical protein [Mycobacteriales bacterium]